MIHIVGAGFSGLTLAWELQKAGLKVTVYEKNQIGGLIHSHRTPTHLRETAANGVLWSPRLEVLSQELGVEFQSSQASAKKRFIFHNQRPRRWPLNFTETLKVFVAGCKFVLKKIFSKQKISSNLTLEQWGTQSFGKPFTDVILSSAVQGIFALTPKHLNAKAVLESFKAVTAFKKAKKYKPVTYAPKNGMGELILALKQKLAEKNVMIKSQEIHDLKDLTLEKNDVVVIATSAWDACKLVPQAGLNQIQAVPLTTVTLVWPKEAPTIEGFGCLFPPVEHFFAAGALVNSCIFANRGSNPSETWIISQDLEKFSDEQIKQHVLMDRQRLFANQGQALECYITRWPKAIPAYNQQLENFLEAYYQQTAKALAKENIYLSGNYLGKIGLAKIYDQNIVLAKKLKVHYG